MHNVEMQGSDALVVVVATTLLQKPCSFLAKVLLTYLPLNRATHIQCR